ncbi:MAG: hypothetical protein AAGH17_07555 [Pseudomonadota bacterium]
MTRITGSRDCGNSPKNKLAQDIGVALACGQHLEDVFPDSIVWDQGDIVWDQGDHLCGGLAQVLDSLAIVPVPVAVTVEHAITHGKVGATSGLCQMADGSQRRYSHVFEFTTTKANQVAVIKSYR